MSTIPVLTGKAGKIFHAVLEKMTQAPKDGAGDFIYEAWQLYQANFVQTPSVTGRVFEYLVAHVLVAHTIAPLYYQARFIHVPNADFDFVLYDPRRPVVLTLKTTLRERYEQADLEGVALKQVYRSAQCVLITLSDEGEGVARKIANNEVTGLDSKMLSESTCRNKGLVVEMDKDSHPSQIVGHS